MPDRGGEAARAVAIAALDAALAPYGSVRLTAWQLAMYEARSAVAGWRMVVDFAGDRRALDLLVDDCFPRSAVRFALVEAPPFLTWPHVEKDRVLCLLGKGADVSPYEPVKAAMVVFGLACELVELLLSGEYEGEFKKEFLSYWTWDLPPEAPQLHSLLRPGGPSRLIRVGRGRRWRLLGESDEQLRQWLDNIGASAKQGDLQFSAGVLIWRDEPLVPSQFPNTALDVLAMADADGAALINELAAKAPASLDLALGAASANGPCFGAVTLSPVRMRHGPGRSRARDFNAGFRPGRTPPDLVSRRFLEKAASQRGKVERADHGWVHGRDHDPRASVLGDVTVTVIGCGSVGAPIALLLAQAGVGRVRLIDGELLTFANIGRHPLGAEDVGLNKAERLAARIGRQLPHVAVEAYPVPWEALPDDLDIFADSDLVISAIGHWAAEGALNARHLHEGGRPPILYAWTEAHACAGHAVLVGPDRGCLQCGLDVFGAPLAPVTAWPETTLHQEPACGAVFQPYGPVELSSITGMSAELALDWLLERADPGAYRVWVGRVARLQEAGGDWADGWPGEHPAGGYVAERIWAPAANCAQCGGAAAIA